MVRQLLTYTLIVSLLLQLFSREVIVMSFALNRDYIAKTLCENRNRPELHCDGKCYLAKRLKARQAREDQETTERVHNMPVIALFCADLFSYTFAETSANPTADVAMWVYQQAAYTAPLHGVFQPPRIG